MRNLLMVALLLTLAVGCTGKLEDKLDVLLDEQKDLRGRLAAIEQSQEELNRAAHASESKPAEGAAGTTASVHVARDSVVMSDDLAGQMAERIMAMVQQTVESTVDARIASQVGTPDDIEAIMSEVVEDEIAAKAEADRLEAETRRRKQAAEWDVRLLDRRATSAGLDDATRTAVSAARSSMNDALRTQLQELHSQNASMEEMLAAVASSRENYEIELEQIMKDEELKAFKDADWWTKRQQGHVDQLATAVNLNDEQKTQVNGAYADMRTKIGDGFVLMREGYLDGRSARQGSEIMYQSFTDTMGTILTPEQLTAYESNPDLRFGRGLRRGRGW